METIAVFGPFNQAMQAALQNSLSAISFHLVFSPEMDQALLEQADTMEDIISLENALGDVEYQIEQYSTELRRYDGLVDYATIGVELLDHIIVAEDDYVSLADRGILQR